MKKLFISFIVLIATAATAGLPDVVALVNNDPITSHEFQSRKKMLMTLNNIQTADTNNINNQLNQAALNGLIDEALLFQYQQKAGILITEEDIDNAIASIDEKNKMPEGYFLNFFKTQGVDVNSFRSQIKSELIKMNILSHLSRVVSVSPKEVDSVIIASNSKDAKISAQIFTSKDKQEKTLRKMYNLQKKLKSCDKLKESMYSGFATNVAIEGNLSTLDRQIQALVKDLENDQVSSVFEAADGFKLILVCNKEITGVTSEENNYVINFLNNKKMSQKLQKFLVDLRKRAYIKVMLPK